MSGSTPTPTPVTVRSRILAAARPRLFHSGYSALTMDDLARELGLSKKTLYRHFPSKDALVAEVLNNFSAEVRATAEALFADRDLAFTDKMHRFIEGMTKRFTGIHPHVFRDLQRYAPHLYQHIEEMRQKNIPVIFGQLVRQGRAAGAVRADVDPVFAVTFWRAAISTLMHPDTLEQLGLRPDQIFPQAINLFFGGLLTPAGLKAYEKIHAP